MTGQYINQVAVCKKCGHTNKSHNTSGTRCDYLGCSCNEWVYDYMAEEF